MLPASKGVALGWRAAIAIGTILLLFILWHPLSKLFWQILFAFLMAALALPIAKWLDRHMRRSLAAFGAVGMLVLGAFGLIGLLLPHMITQISLIITQAPRLIDQARQFWHHLSQQEWIQSLGLDTGAPDQWMNRIALWAGKNLPVFLSGIGTAADAVSRAFLAPVLSYYFLRDREIFCYRLSLWIPARHRKRVLIALHEMRREAGSYIRGQMMVALSVGALTAFGLLLVGIPAWLALGLIMGICELIPYIGPIIGAIPIAFFSLPMGLTTVIWALAVAIAVQQIEGYFLSPHLMAGATGLHPVYILLLLSAGGLLGGLIGMVAVLPIFVCIRGAARVLYETRSTNVKHSKLTQE